MTGTLILPSTPEYIMEAVERTRTTICTQGIWRLYCLLLLAAVVLVFSPIKNDAAWCTVHTISWPNVSPFKNCIAVVPGIHTSHWYIYLVSGTTYLLYTWYVFRTSNYILRPSNEYIISYQIPVLLWQSTAVPGRYYRGTRNNVQQSLLSIKYSPAAYESLRFATRFDTVTEINSVEHKGYNLTFSFASCIST